MEVARNLGSLCGRMGVEVVCGGGNTGLMTALIEGCVAAGGTVTGIIPQFMIDRGWHSPYVTHIVVTPGMHPRKEAMLAGASVAVAMPGGIGTFEELLEAITWRQLGLYHGDVVIVNTAGYYTPLISMLGQAVEKGFMSETDLGLFRVVDDVNDIFDAHDQR